MTCYQRHLGWLFDSVGVPMDKEQKRAIHRELVAMLGLADDAACPQVWAALKSTYGIDATTPSAELAADLSARLGAQ